MIKLTTVALVLDGGSKILRGDDGKLYWQSFEIGKEARRGKIFEGDINDKPKLAKGEFVLMGSRRDQASHKTRLVETIIQ